MKIYTKTGDKGTTRLVDGSCVEKFNPRVEAYGCVDELNSYLGYARALIFNSLPQTVELQPAEFQSVDQMLEKIQNHLFNVGSLLATEKIEVFQKLPQITEVEVSYLEKQIDHYSEQLPPLKNFILPGGSLLASQLHICRTACRRAERRSSEIIMKQPEAINLLIYLNRLSDLFFILARWINLKTNHVEVLWMKDLEGKS